MARVGETKNAYVHKSLLMGFILDEESLERVDSCSRLGNDVGEDFHVDLCRIKDVLVVYNLHEPGLDLSGPYKC